MLRLRTLGGLDLSDADGHPHSLLSQPKRLGLLVYLATANGHGYRRRDNILPLFWPELDDVRARGALRQATYVLRHELGDGVIRTRGDDELGVHPAALLFDVAAFDAALAAGDHRAAADLYRGDFLEGFYVAGSGPEFDEWVAAERRRLRSLASRAMWAVAADAAVSDVGERPVWIRRAVALAPDDEVAVRQALVRLAQVGDRAGAMQLYHEFRERLEREYGAQPATETKAIAEALRLSQEPGRTPIPPSDEHAALPGPAAVRDTAPTPTRRRITRRAWTAGAVGIALVASGWTFYYKIADARSRNGSPGYSIVVADIAMPASDSLSARALTAHLRSQLSGSAKITVVSRADIQASLRRMALPVTTRLDDSIARGIATRDGYASLLTTEIAKVGTGYLLTARLTAMSGPDLAVASETVTSADALIPAVGRLARTLRSKLGESHQVLLAMPPLQRVTTPSLRALELFNLAQDGPEPPRMMENLREALTIDSTFAMAHRRLGLALMARGLWREALEEVQAGARFSEGLSQIERLQALASLHNLLRDHNRSLAEITEILRLEPGNPWARTNLVYQCLISGQYDRADREQRDRGPIPGRLANEFWSTIREYQGRGAEALDSARANFRRHQDSTATTMRRLARNRMATVHALRFAYDSASLYATPDSGSDPGSPIVLAASQFARGKLDEAFAIQRRRAIQMDGERLNSARTAAESYNAIATLLISGNRASANHSIDAALADTAFRKRDPANRHIRPILALALAGRAADAHRELAAIERASSADLLKLRETDIEIGRGAVALAENRPRDAIGAFISASTTIDLESHDACRVCALPWLGRAYEAVGRPDSAATTYERYLSTGDPMRMLADAAWRATILRRLGALHAQLGDTALAVKRLSEFIDLWKNADAQLQPEVNKARRRVAELSGLTR